MPPSSKPWPSTAITPTPPLPRSIGWRRQPPNSSPPSPSAAAPRRPAKRAKALLAAMTAPPPAADAAAIEYKDADQAAARALALQMEALSASTDAAAIRDGYAAARVAWVELLADAEVQPAIVEEFETLSDRVRTALAADEAARAEEARRAAAVRQEQAERLALCERLEAMSGDDLQAGLATARAEWEGLPPMAESWAADVQRRFDDAARAAERRHGQLEEAAGARRPGARRSSPRPKA